MGWLLQSWRQSLLLRHWPNMHVHGHTHEHKHTHTQHGGKNRAWWEGGNQQEDRESGGVVLASLLLLYKLPYVSSLFKVPSITEGKSKAPGAQSTGSHYIYTQKQRGWMQAGAELVFSILYSFYIVEVSRSRDWPTYSQDESSHINCQNKDNSPQTCPVAHLPESSGFGPVVNMVTWPQHILCIYLISKTPLYLKKGPLLNKSKILKKSFHHSWQLPC